MQLLTHTGRLTAYALACGYVEEYGDNLTLSWEHCAYMVKGFLSNGKHVMEGRRTLTEARQLARSLYTQLEGVHK